MHKTVSLLIFVSLMSFIAPSFACRSATDEEGRKMEAKAGREELRSQINEATKNADFIFVGRLNEEVQSLEIQEKNVKRFTPKFEILKSIKGKLIKDQAIWWDEKLNAIQVTCGIYGGFGIIHLQSGSRYLVMVKAGEIIHARRVVDWKEGISYEEEFELVQRAVKQK